MKRALALILLLLLLAGGPVWLLGTESGLRQSLRWVEAAAGGRLVLDKASGRWWDAVSLEALRYEGDGLHLRLRELRLRWQPLQILLGQVAIESLTAAEAELHWIAGADDQDPGRDPLSLEAPLPIYLDALELGRLELRRADAEPQLMQQLRLRGFWRGPWIHLEQLALVHQATGPLQAQGDLILAFGDLQLRELRVQGPGRLLVNGRWPLGEGRRGDLRFEGEGLRWPLVGEAQLQDVGATGWIQGRSAAFDWSARVHHGPSVVEGEGQWAGAGLSADIRWRDLLDPLQPAAPRWRSAQGRARLDGRPTGYRWSVEAQLAAREREALLIAEGEGDRESLRIGSGRLEGFGGSLGAEGRLRWAPALSADLDLVARGLDPSAFFPEWPGVLNGRVRLESRRREEGAETRFDLALQDSRLRGFPLRLTGKGLYQAQGELRVDQALLQVGDSRLQLQGRLTPPYEVEGRLQSPDLRQLWPELRGTARLDFQFRGTRSEPQLRAVGKAEGLRYGTYRAAQLNLDADLHPRRPSRLRVDAAGIRLPQPVEHVRLDGSGTAASHRLELRARAEEGETVLLAAGRLHLKGWRWIGAVEDLRVEPTEGAPWRLMAAADLRVDPQLQRLEPLCLRQADSFACLGLQRRAGYLDLRLRLQSFAIALLRPLLPADWRPEGTVSGAFEAQVRDGEVQQVEGELQTSAGVVRAGTAVQLRFLPSRLALVPLEGGRVRAEAQLQMAAGVGRLDVELGRAGSLLRRPLSGSARFDSEDIGFLKLASPEIAAAEGILQAQFRFSGTLGDPQIEGQLVLRDAAVQLVTPGIRLTDIAVRLESESRGVLQVEAGAHSGEGRLELVGRLRHQQSSLQGEFDLRGDDFLAASTPAARIWISPQLRLQLDGRQVQLQGRIDVPRAHIAPRQFELGAAPSADQVLVGVETEEAEPPLQLRSEVLLRLGKQVSFEGFGLRSGLTGEILAIDRPDRPTIGRGELRLEGGRYKAYGQELEIESGRLIFAGGPVTVPGLEVRAVRKPRPDVKVGVLVRGTLEDPAFRLFSEPAMSQDQQLAWLVLGRPMDDATEGAERDLLATAALSLGLKGGDFLAQRLGKELGFDQITLGSRPGETAEQAQLTVGKYLSSRLFVSYGFGLFQPGRLFRLQYDLGRGFKLETETGVNTSGDLLYTIER